MMRCEDRYSSLVPLLDDAHGVRCTRRTAHDGPHHCVRGGQLVAEWGCGSAARAQGLVPATSWPWWYRPSKERPRGNARVQRGLHPMGKALGPEHSRCSSCRHLVSSVWSRRYYGCALVPQTRSAAADVVRSWRGCSSWAPEEGE